MTPLRALLISDGRPGHETLAQGIVAAIARLRAVDCARLEVRRPRVIPTSVVSMLTNRGLPSEFIMRRVYGIDPAALAPADIIVSAGGDTLAANIAAARLSGGIPNLFYGSLRRFKPDDFALVLNSYARYQSDPRFLVTLKPSKLDPNTLPIADYTTSMPPRIAGLLLGGETKTMVFGRANWTRIVDFIAAAQAQHGTRWIVSNSRRTPDDVSDQFASLAAQVSSPVTRFVDVRRAGGGTLGEVFAAAQAICVTADSSSMLSEAIWARRPVIALAPARSVRPRAELIPGELTPDELTPDELDYRRYLSDSGWTATLRLDEITPQTWLDQLAKLTPLNDNPLDLLAADLQRRLPQIFALK